MKKTSVFGKVEKDFEKLMQVSEVKRHQTWDLFKVIEGLGDLNLRGKLESDFFDLIMSVVGGTPVESTVALIKRFVEKYDDYDFVKTIRKILIGDRMIVTSSDANSAIIDTITLTLAFYNKGLLRGVDSEKVTLLWGKGLTPVDIRILGVIIILQKGYQKRIENFEVNLTKLEVTTLLEKLKAKALPREIESWMNLPFLKLVTQLNNNGAAGSVAYVMNMYNEISDNYQVLNDLSSYVHWERENSQTGSSTLLSMYSFIFSDKFCGNDFMKHRDVYVRDKGIRIILKETFDDVKSITLREFHSFDRGEEHYLLISYETNKVQRFFPMNMANLDRSFVPVLYEVDVTVSFFVMAWLGLTKKLDLSKDHFRNVIGRGFLDLRKDVIEILETFERTAREDNLHYEVPSQWNYDEHTGKNTKRNNDAPVYVREKRKIGRYTRKLPAGRKPSREALELAKRYFIELPEGETLVEEFERDQRIRINK